MLLILAFPRITCSVIDPQATADYSPAEKNKPALLNY